MRKPLPLGFKKKRAESNATVRPAGPTQQDITTARMRVVAAELDKLQHDAQARLAGVEGKAQFLAVASGVIIAAAVTLEPQASLLGLSPLLLSGGAVILSAIALRPAQRRELNAELLLATLESYKPVEILEMQIVKSKADNLRTRETALKSRAALATGGFGLLIAGVAMLVINYWLIISGTAGE